MYKLIGSKHIKFLSPSIEFKPKVYNLSIVQLLKSGDPPTTYNIQCLPVCVDLSSYVRLSVSHFMTHFWVLYIDYVF